MVVVRTHVITSKEKGLYFSLRPHFYFIFLRFKVFLNRMNLGFGVIQSSSMSSVVLLRQKNSPSLKCFQSLACY